MALIPNLVTAKLCYACHGVGTWGVVILRHYSKTGSEVFNQASMKQIQGKSVNSGNNNQSEHVFPRDKKTSVR